MKTIKNLLAALLISFCGASAALAETKAEEPKTVQQTPAQPGQLTEESLKAMLETLGYDVEVEKTESGTHFYVKVVRNGRNYTVDINLSSSKTKLWGSLALRELKPEHSAQAARLLKLLEINQKIGPCHFYYYPPHKFLYLAKATDNRAITPKVVREHIEGLVDVCVQYTADWDADAWGTSTTAVNPK